MKQAKILAKATYLDFPLPPAMGTDDSTKARKPQQGHIITASTLIIMIVIIISLLNSQSLSTDP